MGHASSALALEVYARKDGARPRFRGTDGRAHQATARRSRSHVENGSASTVNVAHELETLRNEAVTVRNDLAAIYAQLPSTDPRVMTARHLKAIVSSTLLSWIHLEENVAEPAWWERTFGTVPPAGQDEVTDYETLVTASFVVYSLSLFEAGLRRLVRAIDSTACGSGAAPFKTIYDWLFAQLHRSDWSYSRGEKTQFLDLYREVRNTLHNNGIFYRADGRNVTVTWRGTQYEFVHGQAPAFLSWELDIALVRELVHLNDEIVRSETIAALPVIP